MDEHHHHDGAERWKHDGIRVIKGDQLDPNTAQTPGMFRQAAINHARVAAQKIWAGTVAIEPNAKTGVHHHGPLESVIFVIRGKARMRWGDHLEYVAEAGPGDFIFVPPYVPHQEINADPENSLECVLVRSDNEAAVSQNFHHIKGGRISGRTYAASSAKSWNGERLLLANCFLRIICATSMPAIVAEAL